MLNVLFRLNCKDWRPRSLSDALVGSREASNQWALWAAVRMWRGEKWCKNRGREGKAERRHNRVRGGDTRAGRGGGGSGEVWFCTGAAVLVVTWAVTAGRRWKRGPTGWRQTQGGGEGSQRRRKKAWFLFLFTTEECPLREWDVSQPPPAAAPLGPNCFLWEHWAPCLSDPQPPSPRFVGVSQHTQTEDGGRRVHLHVFIMRNITADGRCVKKYSERDRKKRSLTLWINSIPSDSASGSTTYKYFQYRLFYRLL